MDVSYSNTWVHGHMGTKTIIMMLSNSTIVSLLSNCNSLLAIVYLQWHFVFNIDDYHITYEVSYKNLRLIVKPFENSMRIS